MRQNKNTKAGVLLVLFTIVAMFAFDHIITEIVTMTGRATETGGRVSVTIGEKNETVVNETIPRGGQRSGGSEASLGLAIHSTTKKNIENLQITAEEQKQKEVIFFLENIGDITLNLILSYTNPLFSIIPDKLILNPKKERAVTFLIKPTEPGVYTDRINVIDKYLLRQLPVIVTVEPKVTDFIVQIVIPEAFKTIQPGKELLAKIEARPFRGQSVVIHYLLKDMQDTIVHEEHERVSVLKELKIDKTIKLPDNLKEGDYVFITTIDYQRSSNFASDTFKVSKTKPAIKEQPQKTNKNKLLLLFAIAILIIVTHLLLHRKKR